MNVVREIQRINQLETASGEWSETGSWHAQYADTAWIHVGGLDYSLSEGDVIAICSQYGEISRIKLPRDGKTGKSLGFVFVLYEDQRSSILAVDNLNGSNVLGRVIKVDHSYGPRPKKRRDQEEETEEEVLGHNVAPPILQAESEESSDDEPDAGNAIDKEDPMAAYLLEQQKGSKKKKKKDREGKKSKDDRKKKKRSRDYSRDSDERERDRETDRNERKRSRDERESRSHRSHHHHRRHDSCERSPSPSRHKSYNKSSSRR